MTSTQIKQAQYEMCNVSRVYTGAVHENVRPPDHTDFTLTMDRVNSLRGKTDARALGREGTSALMQMTGSIRRPSSATGLNGPRYHLPEIRGNAGTPAVSR